MRLFLIAAALAALMPAAQGEDWIAVCYEQDVQYTQKIGGAGFFHVANGNGTYDTQKLVQSFHDANQVCAVADPQAPRAQSEVAEVCASKTRKTISVMLLGDRRPVKPENAKTYCDARISVY